MSEFLVANNGFVVEILFTGFFFCGIDDSGEFGDHSQASSGRRPSDGVAIACRVSAPIFAAESVMDAASQDLSILASPEDEEDEDDDSAFDE